MFDAIAPRYDFLNHLLSAGIDRHWRHLRDSVARSDRSRARPRLVYRHRRSRDRRAQGAAWRGARRRRGLRRRHADDRRRQAASRAALGPGCAGQRGRDAHPRRRRVGGCRHDRIRHSERRRRDDGVPRDVPRAQAWRPARDPRVRDSHHAAVQGRVLAYFRHILPRIGRLVSGHAAAYGYLPASVGTFASPDELTELLRKNGFRDVSANSLTFGSVFLYTAKRLEAGG